MTELIWEGKYDKNGKKTAPVRIALPFQTIETVNESAQERQKTLDLFAGGQPGEWRNRLIWGDKKYVLPSLLPEFAGKVNLIYIDPPFDTGADFSFTATIPDNPETAEDETTQFTKKASIIEQKAYRDTWGKGVESYLHWFYETAILLRELLAEDGSIYVHIGPNISHYVKIILDEIFGYDSYKNEIIWTRTAAHSGGNKYGIITDSIFYYTKSDNFIFNTQYKKHDESYIKSHYSQKDPTGRRYQLVDLSGAGSGPPRKFKDKFLDPPKGRHWAYDQEGINRLMKEDRIVFTDSGRPRLKKFLDEVKGAVIQSVWNDIFPVNSQAKERIDYPTQKPEALIERIIKTSSNENDLILDCFAGSGTTAAVAEKLNRRWITCDLGRFAIHTTRKRLLQIPNVKPFVVQNLGKYERQQWMGAEFPSISERAAVEQRYRRFIVQLFQAESVSGFVWLHGVKAGRMVHVGAVDTPVSIGDVKNIVQEFWRSVGRPGYDPSDEMPGPEVSSGKPTPGPSREGNPIETNGVDILGWDFAFEINETARQFAAANNVDIKFKKIPHEVLEKKAVEQGDIKFYELASLAVDTETSENEVRITLSNFIMPPDDVPEEIRTSISHWQQWIDYWAIDWNYRNDTFHNEWQSYRTKKEPGIDLSVKHTYDKPGAYKIVVKVIDILGNDTTKLLEINL
ncbi:site-specific DNA-methyltransferase [candidate division KSB1 bacterium]|nr:site-specific DNA-methyltransferase [candidate division KSB1 bacterium]